ncbi:hypothetical protein [Zobellella taiwanensis]|uniref:hypothetical protein n=1 Tax=Zobellella taiwanensis TaxID=347535 RepID=UPI0011B20F7D|nr:hypothetical protein [Zobellella taiwanensis]
MGIASLGEFKVRIANLGLQCEHIYTHLPELANPCACHFFEITINQLKIKRLFFIHQDVETEGKVTRVRYANFLPPFLLP